MGTVGIATIRPTGIYSGYDPPLPAGQWSLVGAGSYLAAFNDNSDGSYAHHTGSTNLSFGTVVTFSGAFVNPSTLISVDSVQAKARIRLTYIGGGFQDPNYDTMVVQFGNNLPGLNPTQYPLRGRKTTYGLTTEATVPQSRYGGGSFSQSEINGLLVLLTSESAQWAAPQNDVDIMDAWIEVTYTYNAPPGTPTGLQVTSPVTTTTPTFQAVVPDDGTAKARFEVYDNAGTTLLGTVDSSFVTGNTAASATYGSALPVGQYKVRAQTIDDIAQASGWTSMLSFQINTAVTKDSTYLWNVASPTVPVSKDQTLRWNVAENNAKQQTLLWTVYQAVIVDSRLLWNVKTAWAPVPETPSTWTEVPEG